MTDYTKDVIAYFLNDKEMDAPEDEDLISCVEYHDWIDGICEYRNIDDCVKDYVDFASMLMENGDVEIYVRHYDGRFQEFCEWMKEDGCAWKGRENECIKSAPRNNIFVIECF